jgi:hypothetical protein
LVPFQDAFLGWQGTSDDPLREACERASHFTANLPGVAPGRVESLRAWLRASRLKDPVAREVALRLLSGGVVSSADAVEALSGDIASR